MLAFILLQGVVNLIMKVQFTQSLPRSQAGHVYRGSSSDTRTGPGD